MKTLNAFFILIAVQMTFTSCNVQVRQTNINNMKDSIKPTTLDDPTEFDKKNSQFVMADTVKVFYGDTISTQILNADSVSVYWLNPNQKDTITGFYNYKILKSIENITSSQLDTLKSILVSEKSYIFADYAKLCRFKPVLCFYIKKNDLVIVNK